MKDEVVRAGTMDASMPEARVGAGVWEVAGARATMVVVAEARARARARAVEAEAEAGTLEVLATSTRWRVLEPKLGGRGGRRRSNGDEQRRAKC